jgi:zinc transporter ZupT
LANSFKQQSPAKDMVISYVTIRKAVGYIAISFTPVLALGTVVIGQCPGLRDSASAYFYTSMGSYFVGALCAVALFLFTYKGYDTVDQIVTNIAALFALGIVFFPTDESISPSACNVLHRLPDGFTNTAHYISAGIFFVLMACMSLFLFTKTAPGGKPTPHKLKRNVVYKTCGYIMLVAMALIPCLKINGLPPAILNHQPEFWLESTILITFGVSWLTKGLGGF